MQKVNRAAVSKQIELATFEKFKKNIGPETGSTNKIYHKMNMTPTKKQFQKRLKKLEKEHNKLVSKKNKPVTKNYNGIYYRYKRPIITAAHVPLHWRYDLNFETNPYLMQRIGVNATFNSGAI